MILIAAAAVIIILTLLLGIKRSSKRDVFHLLAVLISAAAAYFITISFADKLYSFGESKYGFGTEDLPFFRQMITSAARPAVITAAFIVLFIIIGLIFHFIARDKKKDKDQEKKKPNVLLKLVLNLISGIVIAAVFVIPADFCASNYGKLLDIAESYGMGIEEELPDLEKYGLGSDLLRPVENALTKVEYDGQEFSLAQCAECAKGFSTIFNKSGDEETVKGLIETLRTDEGADRLYGILSTELSDTIQDSRLRKVLEQEGRTSNKLCAILEIQQLKDMMAGKIDTYSTLKGFLENAEKDKNTALAALCTFDEIKLVNFKGGYNAPLIADIIKHMADIPDKSPEGIEKEAQALTYLFNIDPIDTQSCFNYNDLDPDLVAKYINDSWLLKNAYINVTENGTVTDPCGVASRVFSYYSSTIIYRLDTVYGFGPDSDLYKSLLAFFDIKEI